MERQVSVGRSNRRRTTSGGGQVDHFERKISPRTEAFHFFLHRNIRNFWHNGKHPLQSGVSFDIQTTRNFVPRFSYLTVARRDEQERTLGTKLDNAKSFCQVPLMSLPCCGLSHRGLLRILFFFYRRDPSLLHSRSFCVGRRVVRRHKELRL